MLLKSSAEIFSNVQRAKGEIMRLTEAVEEDAPTFKNWINGEEFEYARPESEVIDYINETIDYTQLEEFSNIDGWDEYFEESDIEKESNRAKAAKNHIRTYVEKRSG